MKKNSLNLYGFICLAIIFLPVLCYSQDVRLLVDESGSMKITDPQRLRVPAIKLISFLLPEHSKAGIWGFSSNTKNLVPLAKVNHQWKAQAKQKANNINSEGQFTNIGRAIETISKDWFMQQATEDRMIILLTDGKVDISNNQGKNLDEKQRILSKLIPKLNQHKISVYTIGLSDQVDKHLLSELSYKTKGTFQILDSADKLQDSYYQIFNTAVDSNEIALVNNTFEINNTIEEFTLVVMRKNEHDLSLIMPNGATFSLEQATTFKTAKFRFITVTNPMVGKWQVKGLKNKNFRILVKSDLSLASVRFQHHLFAGEKVIASAYLTKNGKRLKDKEIIKNTEISLSINQQKPIILNKPTQYEINYRKVFFLPQILKDFFIAKYIAKNKKFNLLKSQLVRVSPFPFKVIFRKKSAHTMQVHITSNSSTIINSKLSGEIHYLTKKVPLSFRKYSTNKYFAKYAIDCIGNTYKVILYISGRKISGQSFEFKPLTRQLSCRKKIMTKSYIEPADDSNMTVKPTANLSKKIIKKEQENKGTIIPMLVTALSLLVVLIAIALTLTFFKRKSRTKQLNNIINEFIDKPPQDPPKEPKND